MPSPASARRLGQIRGAAAVADPHLGAVTREQARGGDAAAGGARDERPATGQRMMPVEGHWSLNVVRDSIASRTPTM